MDDIAVKLLEKMYSEFTKRFEALETGLQETRKELKQDIQVTNNHIMRLENEFKDKFGAIKDELAIVREDISILKVDVAEIKERVDRHDIKIQVIEGGKRKKAK